VGLGIGGGLWAELLAIGIELHARPESFIVLLATARSRGTPSRPIASASGDAMNRDILLLLSSLMGLVNSTELDSVAGVA
jgi:hypothetical protein